MKNIKTQLILLTAMFSISFLDGALGIGVSDWFYVLMGMTMVGTLIWMWVDYARS